MAEGKARAGTVDGGKADALCKNCGQAFSAFLQQMEEHNAKVVVCPACGKVHEYNPPARAVKTPARRR